MTQATAQAHPNVALIKHWGNADENLSLPVNSSLGINLGDFYVKAQVRWLDDTTSDSVMLDGHPVSDETARLIADCLSLIRQYAHLNHFAIVELTTNLLPGFDLGFRPTAVAATLFAAAGAADLDLPQQRLSILARSVSGSAARSIPPGFVVWYAGNSTEASYAESIAPAEHWELVDVLAVVGQGHPPLSHPTAITSDLQAGRVAGANQRMEDARAAILARDFASLADIVELDTHLFQAVLMTSQPPIFNWSPTTVAVMRAIRKWRAEGLDVCYTLDDGSVVHCICTASAAPVVESRLSTMDGVAQILTSGVGGGATYLSSSV